MHVRLYPKTASMIRYLKWKSAYSWNTSSVKKWMDNKKEVLTAFKNERIKAEVEEWVSIILMKS